MINHRFRLEHFFQEVLYLIDNWINEGSGWIVESIESQYINISTYRPLSESSYMNLSVELRSPKKGLINLLFLVICCQNTVKKIANKYERKVGDVKKK